jgi:hypothetical protein
VTNKLASPLVTTALWVVLAVGVFAGMFIGRWMGEIRRARLEFVRARESLDRQTASMVGLDATVTPNTSAPRSYLFMNSRLALDLYSQLFEAGALPSSSEVEESSDRSGSFGLDRWGITGSRNRGRAEKTRHAFTPEDNPARAIHAVEINLGNKALIRDVNLAVDTNRGPFEKFLRVVGNNARSLGFSLSNSIIASIEAEWRASQESGDLDSIASLTGYVRILGMSGFEEISQLHWMAIM